MPLIHSSSDAAFEQNKKTLFGEIGHSPHVQSRDQALAIAFATKRRGRAMGGFADGGDTGSVPLPTPDPRTPDFVFNSIQNYASKVGRPPEKFTGQDITNLQKGLGVTSGRPERAFGGLAPTPWEVRSEARNLMHTGPIYSEVPGRTDAHNMNVPGGSYVVTAENVAHLGQGNSLAGMAVLNKMFGPSGPYGVGRNMPITRGPGPPRPPRAMSDVGGARGEQALGHPVPIRSAGMEFVIPHDVVANVALVHTGHRNIHHGHQILDALQMTWHKEHMGELKKYPGPAKS